ncbi:hypothetical protein OY671_008625, partial [Metschnikowia pulcherrima]
PEDPKSRAQIRAMMKGASVAWDPVAGRRVWSVPMPSPWNGGVLSTAGGSVFQGNGTGEFAAYAADSGRKSWSVNSGSGIVAAPVTYRIRGVQYVSASKDAVGPRVNRIVTFRLDGKAPYASPPVDPKVSPPSPASAGDPRQVDEGRTSFHVRCWMCHGDTAVNHGGVPNSRYSQAITDPQMFAAFVSQGVAEPQGMPNFAKDLTAAQAEAIRAYVVKRASDSKADPDAP